mgnify:FL=1
MAIENFIPEVWSANIIEQFHNGTILASIVNRSYEGDAKSGNKIHIPGVVDVKVKDYKAGVSGKRTTAADEVASTGVDLLIDQEKAFDFFVDDIDEAQSNADVMGAYTRSAAAALVEDAEAYLAGMLAAGGTRISGAKAVTDWGSAYAALVTIRKALNAKKVPSAGRYAIVSPSFEEQLLSDASKLTSFQGVGDSAAIREGTVGRLIGMQVITDPYLPDTKPTAIGLIADGFVYASQIERTESLRADNKFADRVRGLHVYGGKVIRPAAVQVYVGA